MNKPLETPVLFLIFNRPDTTEKVFEEIRKAEPKQLFIAADAPREGVEGEKEKCRKTKEIVSKIDWDCEVKRLYRDKNLGCKNAVSGAIDWFFENVEQGIILEDDCLPSQSFFMFCQKMLEKYNNDDRIMHVSGTNPHYGESFTDYSYYFSKFSFVWGWATWKKRWNEYDVDIKNFPEFEKEKIIESIFNEKFKQKYFLDKFKKVYNNKIDTWDYQWTYTIMSSNGLSIYPETNLIHNIGFNENATHTTSADEYKKNNYARNLDFPLKHPKFMLFNSKADKNIFNNSYVSRKAFFLSKIKYSLKTILPNFILDLLKK